MPQDNATAELLRVLGIQRKRALDQTASFRTPALEQEEFGLQAIAEMKRLLSIDPARMLATAPALMGRSPTAAQGNVLLDEAEQALLHPERALHVVRANGESDSFELPPEHQFVGYDTSEIPILPDLRKFEELADSGAWAVTAIAAWWFRLTHDKAPFISHTSSQTSFAYPLMASGNETKVALFSDWGTGYYHSKYIAKHIAREAPGQAIHLGDVYYTGTQSEFDERFIPILEKHITNKIPLYTLNANHEMDTHGLAYFAYLQKRRQSSSIHRQEGSYFCLTSEHYQIIGIDTAFERNGRLRKGDQKNWLQARLSEGKSAKKVNILLSQSEPFEKEARELLTKDLQSMVANKLIDLWFWGDQHYCALYPPGPSTPFGGSCIGHGGYPYRIKDADDFAGHLVRPLFMELEPRFPIDLHVRPGMGNNGFCMLTLTPGSLAIRYLDWRTRERYPIKLPVEDGRLHWPGD